jgi:hypothetical protein
VGLNGETNLELTFEKVVVEVKGTPFGVKVVLEMCGGEWGKRQGIYALDLRISSFQTSWRAEGRKVGGISAGFLYVMSLLDPISATNVLPLTG